MVLEVQETNKLLSKLSHHNCTLLHKTVLSVTLYNIVYKVVTLSLL